MLLPFAREGRRLPVDRQAAVLLLFARERALFVASIENRLVASGKA